MKKLLTGNEAIARGAYEAGVTVATAYPGTPSTEILENIALYKDAIYAEWSTNEKVAMEVALGASLAGARALVAMKHVGVNVAADPLMTASYSGVNGGLVIVSADDPGMHSSQNEQDNRLFAKFAKIPLLEPSDSQECLDFVATALAVSEQYDTPVMLRTTTRISHSKSLVEEGGRHDVPLRAYTKDIPKYVMTPAGAQRRHVIVEQRRAKLIEYAETTPLNRIENPGREIGVVVSGITYQYAREALGDQVSYLKLGFTHPLPERKIREFAASVKRLYVIEELEPYLEEQIRSWGIACHGKDVLPRTGELSAELIAGAVNGQSRAAADGADLPVRPPVMCPGCPHRGVMFVLKKLNCTVTGDIGCYTLGSAPPLTAIDSCICMGASIGMAHGFAKAGGEHRGKLVAVIGDSTFFHSGMTGLINVVYNRANVITMILDNRITAMTGHQHNPGTGQTLLGEVAQQADLEAIVRALGIKHVAVVDPYDLTQVEQTLRELTELPEPAVVIARRPCALIAKPGPERYTILPDKCKQCKACLRLGCPAIEVRPDGTIAINRDNCFGCGVCSDLCKFDALVKEGERHE
ncbi:MAG: indolepyruvate ferredoxin oxidoreductase subunit alpha [Chloroflexota bacterium]